MVNIPRPRFRGPSRPAGEYLKPSTWVLPQESTSFGDEGDWSNIDTDVTPRDRRTWTAFDIAGFWFSDGLNAQGWEAPASIINAGLTWRESIYIIITAYLFDSVPLILNGLIGATYYIPFPVIARASYGFYFSRFVVVVRMCTALFWHAIQTWTGSMAMFQCIRAIWPSFLDVPNMLPESAGVTSNQLIAHFLFWIVQAPILTIPPHKLRWLFVTKFVVVIIVCTAMTIWMTKAAGGVGDIWNQPYRVSGANKSWLILMGFSSSAGGWITMSTNIPDYTRYMKNRRDVSWQVLLVPFVNLLVGIYGIICTSCAQVLYGEYIWSPLDIAAKWDGPWGRCGAFFVGFCWILAQIGTNLTANVVSCSNDMSNLFPKYINIRRGVIIATVIAGWIMVPWKIISSAGSLLTFMSGLSVFLAPIASVIVTDYWLVKGRKLDVPALYRRHGRYRYDYGVNWRAAVAFCVAVIPCLPGLASAVSGSVHISTGAEHIWNINIIYTFYSAAISYYALNLAFPHKPTLLKEKITGDLPVVQGVDRGSDLYETKGMDVNVTKE